MKKVNLLFLLSLCFLGCNETSVLSNSYSFSESSLLEEESSISITSSIESSSESERSIFSMESGKDFETITDFPSFTIEVGQKLYIDCYVRMFKKVEYIIDNDLFKIEDNFLIGLKEGEGRFVFHRGTKYQNVDVKVVPQGTLTRAWNFSSEKQNMKNKNFIVLGDSVSAEETYDNAGHTYVQKICSQYEANFKKNYAIGGTTGTYMYPGSNIEREYKNNDTAIDGPRVAKRAYDKGELNDVDYAFIAFGHNDQYFNPPITVDGDDIYNVDNFDNAFSFKGSYRFMINLLRKANPNVKIILLNCTYSEYAATSRYWKHILTYEDYRKAICELADEMDCKYIDPWNKMKDNFDANGTKIYYNDVVHITRKGHQILSEYIMEH